MSLLEDARELRDIGIETFSPTRGIICAACFTKTHVPGCPVLSLPKIVAALEAAELVASEIGPEPIYDHDDPPVSADAARALVAAFRDEAPTT